MASPDSLQTNLVPDTLSHTYTLLRGLKSVLNPQPPTPSPQPLTPSPSLQPPATDQQARDRQQRHQAKPPGCLARQQ
ncbi:MAG: hypothetical protein OHK0022_15130 [Roseiflexaceae bacterium]